MVQSDLEAMSRRRVAAASGVFGACRWCGPVDTSQRQDLRKASGLAAATQSRGVCQLISRTWDEANKFVRATRELGLSV